jgi:ABC-type dipeptide/oligopeptide/nickel transport system permease component
VDQGLYAACDLQWPELDDSDESRTGHTVSAFILRRLLLSVPTLFGVLVVAFLLLYVAPGDPAQSMVGERADEATIARLRAELHLNDPLYVQFGHYVAGIVKGDLGKSYITNRPIRKDIIERFPKTLQLAGAAMLLATILGVTLGVFSALTPGGLIDRLGLGIAYLGISFPVYWVGLLLILLFAVTLHWLPPSGFGGLRYLILPALALGMRSIAFLARMTRSAMLDALGADYVRTARAKGLTERLVVGRHALRNAMIPIITVLGLDFGAYLTGSILTETIFSWPGLGRYVVNAIARRDLPAIQGSVLFLSAVFVLVNLITDVAYAKADPRVTYS